MAPIITTITRARRAATVLSLALTVAACAPPRTALHPRYAEPIGQIHLRRGRLGWGGLAVGMSFQEVQRVVGRRLSTPAEPGPCDHREVEAEILDQRLVLRFEGGGETGRLAVIGLALPGASARDVAATLEARFPELEPQGGAAAPGTPRPLYRLPAAGEGGLFLVDPQVGVLFGKVCRG